MKLASAIAAREERFVAGHVARLRGTLAEGYSVLYTFDRADGACTRLDVMGPRGMRCSGPANDGGFLAAPVPTVRLWSPSSHQRPLAVAATDRNFEPSLDVLAERAKALVGDEFAVLLALLATIRDHAPRLRPRVPKVALVFTSSGTPSMPAWASCLGLGDLEDALAKRVA
jgi:hypothetical protein